VSFLNSDNGREVVQALQMIQYFDTGIDFFLPVIKTIRKKWDNKTVDANDRQNITNCSDVILHYTDSQYLMYERMAAWNEKEE